MLQGSYEVTKLLHIIFKTEIIILLVDKMKVRSSFRMPVRDTTGILAPPPPPLIMDISALTAWIIDPSSTWTYWDDIRFRDRLRLVRERALAKRHGEEEESASYRRGELRDGVLVVDLAQSQKSMIEIRGLVHGVGSTIVTYQSWETVLQFQPSNIYQ